MQVTQTKAEGLEREFTVVVEANEIASAVDDRLKELSTTVNLPGFRQGKVPLTVMKQRYGKSVLGEVIEKKVSQSSQEAVEKEGLRPAMRPKIEITSFEPEQNLEFKMEVQILPEIKPVDLSKVKLEKLIAEVDDKAIDDALGRLAESHESTKEAPKSHKSAEGDTVVITFSGTVDGEARPGMQGEQFPLKLGSNQFIPGFEEQLTGKKAGDEIDVTVTFPEDYQADDLQGVEAVFKTTIHEIKVPTETKIDDEMAKAFGAESLDDLKEKVRERLGHDYENLSRNRLKRILLDQLADAHEFDVPPGLLEHEFNNIWERVKEEKEHGHLPESDMKKSDEQLEADYREIAERRVRLGLVLTEVGRTNDLSVSEQELQQAMLNEARKYQGQERQVLEYFRNTPEAVDQLRAPLFEEKVIDFMIEKADITEKKATIEEIVADPDDEAPKKETKKKPAAKKKAPAKKKAEK